MAYINFSETPAGQVASAAPAKMDSKQAPAFSALEWSVIALAERDSLSSLGEPGPIASALGSLFGLRRASRLADEQLEALRRAAVLAWHHGYVIAGEEVDAFQTAGFSIDQYEMLQASIARRRSERSRRRFQ